MRNAFGTLSLALALVAACHEATSTKSGPPPTHPSGNTASRLLGFGGRPFAIRVTHNGDVLVTEQDLNRAIHLDSVGATSTNIAVGRDPGDVIANRTGTQAFVSNFNDGTVSIVDLSSNTATKTVAVSLSNAYRLSFNSDESRVYVTSTDGHLYTINTSSQSSGPSVTLSGSVQGIALMHSGQALFVTATDGTIWRLDPSSLATSKSASITNCTAQDVAISTDDTELYVACEGVGVAVLDPTSLVTKTLITISGASPFGLAVSPDNAQLYVTSPIGGVVTILDRAGRTVIKSLPVTGMPRRVAFNAHGNKAYIANEGNWVDVIE